MQAEKPHGRCGAKTRAGDPCRRLPAPGRTRCYSHGGKSLAGPASPRWKDGRYSKLIPANLATSYHNLLEADTLHDLRNEMAALGARFGELLSQLGSGESGRAWQALAKARAAYAAATAAGESPDGPLADLFALIDTGLGDSAVWEEIRATTDQLRRAAEVELKRRKEEREHLTADQALALAAALAEVVRTHVRDRATLAAIGADFDRLLRPSRQLAPAPHH
ncbi:MAG: HGGxSTG domain-containing protein [Dehalococcoidia bacterium]